MYTCRTESMCRYTSTDLMAIMFRSSENNGPRQAFYNCANQIIRWGSDYGLTQI